MIFHRHRQAKKRADDAQREVQAAAERLEETRRDVVRPLKKYQGRNRFSDMIRASLQAGGGHR